MDCMFDTNCYFKKFIVLKFYKPTESRWDYNPILKEKSFLIEN